MPSEKCPNPIFDCYTSNSIQASDDQTLLIRAHLHLEDKDKSGYEARQAWKGTIKDGFKMIRLPENFATDLAKVDPQPKPCQDKSKDSLSLT